ncbi:MAG: hypothetical protein A3K77_00995 [Euryarchaeota archaeon RBG_13_31_8]|nr:MAG: hypothetical protein A3K77_00995 [Euryarchaeota archaeon RBG_13_31_8]
MNKKIIVFGNFLAIFIMLMIPIANAVEFNKVGNNLKEKINPIKEQLKEKNIIASYDSADIEKLNDAINEIKNNPDSLCSSCGKNLLMRPKCKMLLKQFYTLTWLIIVLKEFKIIPNIVFFILTLHALAVVHKAKQIYCLWAL